MRIQTKPLTYEITNKDKNFKGTEFEKSDFRIVLKEINSIENNEIIKNNTTFKTENGKADLVCFGEAKDLNIKSRPQDALILKEALEIEF